MGNHSQAGHPGTAEPPPPPTHPVRSVDLRGDRAAEHPRDPVTPQGAQPRGGRRECMKSSAPQGIWGWRGKFSAGVLGDPHMLPHLPTLPPPPARTAPPPPSPCPGSEGGSQTKQCLIVPAPRPQLPQATAANTAQPDRSPAPGTTPAFSPGSPQPEGERSQHVLGVWGENSYEQGVLPGWDGTPTQLPAPREPHSLCNVRGPVQQQDHVAPDPPPPPKPPLWPGGRSHGRSVPSQGSAPGRAHIRRQPVDLL